MSTAVEARALTTEQLEQYKEQGFFVVRDLFDRNEVDEMLAECESILRGEYGELFAGAVKIDPGSTAEIKAERKVSAVVERSAVFRKYLLKDALVRRLQDILSPDILLYRDILMLKPAVVGSKMPWHQDSNYWAIAPADLCSVWTALDPATLENGCMRVIPGSHKLDLIQSKSQSGNGPLEDDQINVADAIDVPMEPGSSLFFHSRLLHGSEPNHSTQSRRAFITSFMSARSRLTRDEGRSRFFLVSGTTYPDCVRC
jgi:ectoine hydroxylase-related dioxygenase (phytanoyl-CoA dioxygenase family)